MSNPANVLVNHITADSLGNSYICGSFDAILNFEFGALVGSGVPDGFVAKFDPAGKVLWARTVSGSHGDSMTSVVVAQSGEVYVAGKHGPDARMDSYQFPATVNTDWFVAKYDAAGKIQWAAPGGSSVDANTTSVALDNDGNSYATWSAPPRGSFLTKLDATGVKVWERPMPGSALVTSGDAATLFTFAVGRVTKWNVNGDILWMNEVPPATAVITADTTGNLYFAGPIFGAPFIPSFIGALDKDGSLRWMTNGTNTNTGFHGIVPAPNGSILALGWDGVDQNVLVAFDAVGKSFPLQDWKSPTTPCGLATDANGNCYVAGTVIFSPVTLGTANLVTQGLADAFIAKMNLSLTIRTQPIGQFINPGMNADLSIVATSFFPITYQWRRNGANIPGAIQPTFQLHPAQSSDSGDYDVIVSTLLASRTSSVAHLTVDAPPTVRITSPLNRSLQAPGAIDVVVDANDSDGTLSSLQLILDGTLVATNTASSSHFTLNLPNDGIHSFKIRAVDDLGLSSLSDIVTIAVGRKPFLTRTPVAQTIPVHGNVIFSVSATGTPTILYEWFKNGVSMPGQTRSTLSLTNVSFGDSASYALNIANDFGLTSTIPVALSVIEASQPFVTIEADSKPLTNAVYDFAKPVTISMDSFFGNSFIFYTLDGSAPNYSSRLYTAPFSVTHSVMLRAIGYSDDFFSSGETSPVRIDIVPPVRLNASASGGGVLVVDPPGEQFPADTIVHVNAIPSPGWSFLGWTGDSTETNTSITMTMDRPRSVRAVFGTTLTTSVAGGGDLQIYPPASNYPYGSTVHITAVPENGNYLALWGGSAARGNTNPISFSITTAAPKITSLFAPLPENQVALTVIPSGKGWVSMTPAAPFYSRGQTVTIRAFPDLNQKFLGWTGDFTGVQNPVTLNLSDSKIITANFSELFFQISPTDPPAVLFSIDSPLGRVIQVDTTANFVTWTPFKTFTNIVGLLEFTATPSSISSPAFFRLQMP